MATKKPSAGDIMAVLKNVNVTDKPAGSAAVKKPIAKPVVVKAQDKPKPKPAKKQAAGKKQKNPDARLTLYVSKEEHQAIRIKSIMESISVSELLCNAAREAGLFDKLEVS